MAMLADLLLAAAGAIYVFLGGMHGWFTWKDASEPRIIVPRDPAMLEAMRGMPLRIHPQTDFWRAWIGFNFSHTLALLLTGGGLLACAFAWPDAFRASWGLRGVALLLGAIWLVLAIKYFFVRPVQGAGAALALIVAAIVLG